MIICVVLDDQVFQHSTGIHIKNKNAKHPSTIMDILNNAGMLS